MAPRVVLVGAPGSGKSTVGSLVADLLGLGFLDTDAVVEQRAGTTVADLFLSRGEPVFRELEREAVADALLDHDGVLALGGGAVLDPGTRARLVGGPVVWLTVGLSEEVARVGMNQARPLLLGNVRGTLLRLMEERRPLYAEVARAQVDTDTSTPAQVADAVLAALGLHPVAP